MATNPWVNPNPSFTDLWNARPGAPAPVIPPGLPPIGQGPPAGGTGGIPGGSDIIGTGNIPGYGQANTQLSGVIQNLLNPNDAQANYDVTLHGAERAIAGGVPGSGLAAETTGRMRQADIERRAALGANMLLGQEGMDLHNKIASGQLTLEQLRLALDEKVRLGQLSLQQAHYLLGSYGGGGYGNRGGYGGYGGGGTPSYSASPVTSPAPMSLPPYPTPSTFTDPFMPQDYASSGDPNDPSNIEYWYGPGIMDPGTVPADSTFYPPTQEQPSPDFELENLYY